MTDSMSWQTSPQTKLRDLPLEFEEGLPLAATQHASSSSQGASMMAKADDALNAVAHQQSQAAGASSDSENEERSPTPSVPASKQSLQVDWTLFKELAEVRHSLGQRRS